MDWRQVVGRQLEFYRVMDLETQLTTSKWGIREPDPQQVAHSGVRAGAVGLWVCGAGSHWALPAVREGRL